MRSYGMSQRPASHRVSASSVSSLCGRRGSFRFLSARTTSGCTSTGAARGFIVLRSAASCAEINRSAASHDPTSVRSSRRLVGLAGRGSGFFRSMQSLDSLSVQGSATSIDPMGAGRRGRGAAGILYTVLHGSRARRRDRSIHMAKTLNDLPPRAALVEVARDFHQRGWMSGTAGNLSVRTDDDNFWITASGRPKGRLDESDFLLVRIQDGEVVERAAPGNKPSAETAIHRAIYALFPDARACLHGHSVDGCLVSGRAKRAAKALRLPAIEMLKGFDIWVQNPKVDLPLFEKP